MKRENRQCACKRERERGDRKVARHGRREKKQTEL